MHCFPEIRKPVSQRKKESIAISGREANRRIGYWIKLVREGRVRVVIGKFGRPQAALVSIDDLQALLILDDAA
jgi:prevent-host-death family protein